MCSTRHRRLCFNYKLRHPCVCLYVYLCNYSLVILIVGYCYLFDNSLQNKRCSKQGIKIRAGFEHHIFPNFPLSPWFLSVTSLQSHLLCQGISLASAGLPNTLQQISYPTIRSKYGCEQVRKNFILAAAFYPILV